MVLKFERHDAYGKCHFYPKNSPAFAIVEIAGRKCLKMGELIKLGCLGCFDLELTRWPYSEFKTHIRSAEVSESTIALATQGKGRGK